MRVGLIARAEDRGLGTMSRDFYRHMQPDKTLVVIPAGVRHAHLASHLDWYPDSTVIGYDGELDRRKVDEWLEGLDVVYAAETFYDWRFCAWAREAKVATVCHLMPEWWSQRWAREPTAWWAPTSWRLDRLPVGTVHVPVPIDTDSVLPRLPDPGRPFRWLHIAGAKTHADRNGTYLLVDAARALTRPQEIIVRTQSPLTFDHVPDPVTVCEGTVDDRWQMYRDVDAMVMPRRYAGLCLPVLEAIAAGLPVVMSDLSPQNVDWPVATVPAVRDGFRRMMGGRIDLYDTDPALLAGLMDRWATDPTEPAEYAAASRRYATENSWRVRAPQIRAELERVADRVAA
jgi:glycosyltransferase involved in cell wall biosynthesis